MVAAVPVISTPAIDIGMMKIKENDHEQGVGSYGVNTMTEFCCRSDCNADTEFLSSNMQSRLFFTAIRAFARRSKE